MTGSSNNVFTNKSHSSYYEVDQFAVECVRILDQMREKPFLTVLLRCIHFECERNSPFLTMESSSYFAYA